MRIGIAINKAWNIYNFRKGIIKALLSLGHEVIAIAPRDEYVDRLKALGCEFEHLPMTDTGSNPIKELGSIWAFHSILKKSKIDLLLTFTIKCNLYGALVSSWHGIPVLCNISGLGTAFLSNQFSSRVARWMSRKMLRRAQHLFFQNEEDQYDFISATGLYQISQSLLPGSGIDLKKYAAKPMKIPNKYQFLLLARLIVEKGVEEYAEAAAIVRQSFPDCKFLIVGSFNPDHARSINVKDLKAWQEKGWIEYLSHRDDIIEIIGESEVVVLPSYREGTPRSLLEGAALGRPLITTNVPGCKEVVKDGYNGYLCVMRSADSLAEQCLRYLKLSASEQRKMGAHSRKWVEEKFDEQTVISAYLDKIDEVS